MLRICWFDHYYLHYSMQIMLKCVFTVYFRTLESASLFDFEVAMPSHPTVTAEELACLLAGASASDRATSRHTDNSEAWLAQCGAALWLLKGLFLYMVLQMLGLHTLPVHYLWARCALEVLCCAVFWSSLRQPARRAITLGALLVGATTLCMDVLMALAVSA
jgi:hypothetical protein